MPLLRRDRRLGVNLIPPPNGLGFLPFTSMVRDAMDTFDDYRAAQTVDPATLIAEPTPVVQPGGQVPGDEYVPGVSPIAPTLSVTAMPTTTTTTVATAPDGMALPPGATVEENELVWIVTNPDGSQRIIYKNAPPPDDPECVGMDTADINAGLLCQMTPNGNRIYIPTERWTGQVQSWGELKRNMDRFVGNNPDYPESGRHAVIYQNPSWHILNGLTTPDGKFKSPDWRSLMWHVEQGNYSVIGYPDSFVPTYIGPTQTSGGSSMYVVDPDSGERIDVTDNDNVTPEQEQRIEDIFYGPVEDRAPGQPGYQPPVYSGPPIDDNGVVIQPPPYSGPISQPGGPSTTVNLDPSPVAPSNTGMVLAAAALAFLVLKRKG